MIRALPQCTGTSQGIRVAPSDHRPCRRSLSLAQRCPAFRWSPQPLVFPTSTRTGITCNANRNTALSEQSEDSRAADAKDPGSRSQSLEALGQDVSGTEAKNSEGQAEQETSRFAQVSGPLAVIASVIGLEYYLCHADLSLLPGAVGVAKHAADGLVSAGLGALVVYPIDVAKTRMQNQNQTNPQYANIADCFVQIWQQEGLEGLYGGIIPQLMGVSPEKGIKITTYDYLRTMLAPQFSSWLLPTLIAAGAAGCCQVLVTNPLEKTKIQLQLQAEGGERRGIVSICQELGIAGLYQGTPVTVARDIPSVAIFFVAYEAMKQTLTGGAADPTTLQLVIAGLVAGAPAAALVTPMDVVKTRWQAKGGTDKYTSPMDCFQRTVDEEGWRALFAGTGLRILRISPQLSVTLTVYEILASYS